MNESVQHFIRVLASTSELDITGRRVIEVGAGDINGNIRGIIEQFHPASYVGVDMEPGPGVDVVADAENLLEHFAPESFDVVISTELMEHVKHYQKVMISMGAVLAVGGQMLITTRSQPFPYHPYPDDYWRYSLQGLAQLFEGISVRPDIVGPDSLMFGVFGKGTKLGRNVSLRENTPVPGVTAVYRGPVKMDSPVTGEVKDLGGQAGLDFFLSEVSGVKPLVVSVGMEKAEARRIASEIEAIFG